MPSMQVTRIEPERSRRTEIFTHARRVVAAAQAETATSGRSALLLDDDGFTPRERAAGDLLDALAIELRLALLDAALTAPHLLLGDTPNQFVLTGDGCYLRLEAESAWPIRRTAALARVEPELDPLLDDLERGLLGMNRSRAAECAQLVREVRNFLAPTLSPLAH